MYNYKKSFDKLVLAVQKYHVLLEQMSEDNYPEDFDIPYLLKNISKDLDGIIWDAKREAIQ